jgi:uncharacterized protein
VSEPLAAPATPVPPPLAPLEQEYRPVARYLHTFLIVLLMCAVGVMSMLSFKSGRAPAGPMALYIPTIIWLWSLALLVYAGVRRHGLRVRDVFGNTWRSFDDLLMDLAVAAGFWVAAMTVLYAVSRVLMYLLKQPTPKTIPTELQALAPQGALGFALWLVLSISAGICEEFVFRGYLQRQFTALARNAGAGIVLSALVFSVGHLYEGGVKAIVIGIFGILLGVLAHARRSLAPGMIAHAWHDIFAGALLYLLPRMLPH